MNKAILVGHLGRDAEVRYTNDGTPVCRFSLATSEHFRTKDGQDKEQTEWHSVVLWGQTAESLSPYLVKGKAVGVEGKIQTRAWEKDGQKRYATEIRADRVHLLGGDPRTKSADPVKGPVKEIPRPDPVITADDIPF